ncbi:MAG: hypothetical protein HQL70_11665 [Magnetococcales bacterium]|nr:hypothetical protein [Magnetococcales bacterium]
MKFYLSVFAGISLFFIHGSSYGADAAKGKVLHDNSCLTKCHSSRVDGESNDLYKRPNSLDSLAKLTAQVNFCNQQVLDSEWWPEDEADVVAYLNNQFYKFK